MTCSLLASVLFFLVTNFGCWLWFDLYEHSVSGLVHCYARACLSSGTRSRAISCSPTPVRRLRRRETVACQQGGRRPALPQLVDGSLARNNRNGDTADRGITVFSQPPAKALNDPARHAFSGPPGPGGRSTHVSGMLGKTRRTRRGSASHSDAATSPIIIDGVAPSPCPLPPELEGECGAIHGAFRGRGIES